MATSTSVKATDLERLFACSIASSLCARWSDSESLSGGEQLVGGERERGREEEGGDGMMSYTTRCCERLLR